MEDLTKALLTTFFTVLSGVLVFIGGQILMKFIIEPIHNLKQVLGAIQFALSLHAPAVTSSMGKEETWAEAEEVLKKLSSELQSKTVMIPVYRWWEKIHCLPSQNNIFEAVKQIRLLSHSVHKEDRSKNFDIANKICSLLNLKPYE